jgi:hypothetical protein
MNVYGITISGKHPDFFNKRFYGVSQDIDNAMISCISNAKTNGWTNIVIEDVNLLGPLDFITEDAFKESVT